MCMPVYLYIIYSGLKLGQTTTVLWTNLFSHSLVAHLAGDPGLMGEMELGLEQVQERGPVYSRLCKGPRHPGHRKVEPLACLPIPTLVAQAGSSYGLGQGEGGSERNQGVAITVKVLSPSVAHPFSKS